MNMDERHERWDAALVRLNEDHGGDNLVALDDPHERALVVDALKLVADEELARLRAEWHLTLMERLEHTNRLKKEISERDNAAVDAAEMNAEITELDKACNSLDHENAHLRDELTEVKVVAARREAWVNSLRAELEDQRGARRTAAEAADRFRDVVADCLGHADENPGDDVLIAQLRDHFDKTGPEPTGWRDRLTGYEALRDQINAAARPDDTRTETDPTEPPTPRCAHCRHPKRDHSDRRDHRPHPTLPRDPWCHACNAHCDYAEQPECPGCDDTGACAGDPCAHPNAQQPGPADEEERTVTPAEHLDAVAARWEHGHPELTACCALCQAEWAEALATAHQPGTDHGTTGRTTP